MILKAEAKAEIKILKIGRRDVTIEVTMPDKPGARITRTLKEGETYYNTVKLDIELPVESNLTKFQVSS